MEPEARYTIVGATLIALVVAASAFFVWLSRAGVASDYQFFTIYFQDQSLDGLQIGGDVNMKGIKVGRVERFAIDRSNVNRVNVKVRVLRRTPVSTNTVAVIGRNLLTGIARIELQTPGVPGAQLEVVAENEDYPVIAEGSSNIEHLAETANNIVVAADATLEKMGRVLDETNRRNFSEALAALRELATGLNKRLVTIDESSARLNEVAQSFRKTSETIAAAAERTAEQVQPLAKETQATLKETQAAMRDASAAIRRLERDTSLLAQRAETAADVGTLELRATTQQLRAGIETLNRTLERLQDPRAALLGPSERQLGPGERTK
jgi:phospholipid/cholesterol/gamma-HCH transport system substrate-binding protein